MAYENESDLKYIDSLDDIPVSGPDPFDKEAKLKAAEVGEAKIEADAFDGDPIGDDGVLVKDAAAAWASYRLFYGGEAPSSALSGDLVDGSSSDLVEFAREHKSNYNSLLSSITGSEHDRDTGDTGDFHVFGV